MSKAVSTCLKPGKCLSRRPVQKNMANSMRQQQVKPNGLKFKINLACVVWLAYALAVPAVADPALLDKDLHRIDLSDADVSRVLSVTKPTADFSKAEPFEAKPGGATTATTWPTRDILR